MESDERRSPYRTSADAVLTLQTTSSSFDDRISALRFLHLYLEEEKSSNTLYHRRINKLVMDNVMQIIMNEDRTADMRKRQIVRTECFIILASLLGSDSLFGSISNKPLASNQHGLSMTSSSQKNDVNGTGRLGGSGAGDDDEPDEQSSQIEEHSLHEENYLHEGSEKHALHSSISSAADNGQKNVPPNYRNIPADNLSGTRSRIPSKMTVDDINILAGIRPRRGSDFKRDINIDIYKTMYSDFIPSPIKDQNQTSPVNNTNNNSNTNNTNNSNTKKYDHTMGKHSTQDHNNNTNNTNTSSSNNLTPRNGQSTSPKHSESAPTPHTPRTPSIELKLLKPVILKRPVREILRQKALRERPSFFTGGAYRRDGFAPGVDPTNWLEQVRLQIFLLLLLLWLSWLLVAVDVVVVILWVQPTGWNVRWWCFCSCWWYCNVIAVVLYITVAAIVITIILQQLLSLFVLLYMRSN